MIKFVYFDVGGVVIKDFSASNKWDELCNEIGITLDTQGKFEEIWNSCKETRDTVFDVDNLLPVFEKDLGLKLPKDYSFLMGFVKRFEKNESIWSVISEMKKEVPVGLLTNMYPRMLDKIYEANIMPKVGWDAVIDSSVVKIQKPYNDIYKLAEEKANAKGNEILFIDNSKVHLDAAVKFGWQTFWYDSADVETSSRELMEYFKLHK